MKKFELKIWHPIIGIIILQIIGILSNNLIPFTTAWDILNEIASILLGIFLLMFIYLLLRNLFRVIKGQIGKKDR